MNPFRPGSPQAARQAAAPRDGIEADLEMMAMLEGKPLPTVCELAKLFNVSQTTAFRTITRFKQSGMLKLVDRVRLPDSVCHCIADLRTHLTDGGELRRLEARLREDPCVSSAAAITGKYAYRVNALHRGAHEANVWFKALLAEPAVIDGVLIFCRPIIDRHRYAQALVGGRPA